MKTAIVTGSCGLIGSETCRRLHAEGFRVLGIDNHLRSHFFGKEATTEPMKISLEHDLRHYTHLPLDIRDWPAMERIFAEHGRDIAVVVHTAAQPSHDWAAKEPLTDFGVNATGTLHLLEATRLHAPEAVFIFTSTNKVYGDTPNRLPLVETDTRWELDEGHVFFARGIDESMSIDASRHSLFGASKVAADVMVQEYGRYFGMKSVVFRCGCLTGPAHAGVEMHGFLSYLMKCTTEGRAYQVFGHRGKQVRDNLHSADLVEAFCHFMTSPRCGEVYNMGGSRLSHCSLLEAIALCEEISGRTLSWSCREESRVGDHLWWISDVSKFQSHYPQWRQRYLLRETLEEIHAVCGR